MYESYGIDEAGFPSNDSSETVNISPLQFELSVAHYSQLIAIVNPLATSDNFGIDLFQQAMQYVDSVVGAN